LQPPRMFGGGLQQALQPPAQIGRAAYIGLGVRLRSVEGEDRWAGGQLIECGPGVGWVEGQRI
jgi:hypothetical protein